MCERRFDPAMMKKLDSPERRKQLPPDRLLEKLPVGEGETLLDLGAGTGYFTLPAARLTKGKVMALDVEPRMLEVLKQRAEEEGLSHVETVEGVVEEIPLPDASVNHVIASLVLHEVEPLAKGVEEIQRVLQSGGTCFCLEWDAKETEQGPPLHHRIASPQMEKAMEAAGLTVVDRFAPTEAHYLLIAKKK